MDDDEQQECIRKLKLSIEKLKSANPPISGLKRAIRQCKIKVRELRNIAGADPQKHQWFVFAEAGVQGSTLNSASISSNEENPGLFEDNNSFAGFRGEIRQVLLRTWDLGWMLRFGEVDVQLDDDISTTGKTILNNAKTLHLAFDGRRKLYETSWYGGFRLSGYSPTGNTDEEDLRTDLLGEYYLFFGLANQHKDSQLIDSYFQAGYGYSDRFVNEQRGFAETRIVWRGKEDSKTSFFLEFAVTAGKGADDVRAIFGVRRAIFDIGGKGKANAESKPGRNAGSDADDKSVGNPADKPPVVPDEEPVEDPGDEDADEHDASEGSEGEAEPEGAPDPGLMNS